MLCRPHYSINKSQFFAKSDFLAVVTEPEQLEDINKTYLFI